MSKVKSRDEAIGMVEQRIMELEICQLVEPSLSNLIRAMRLREALAFMRSRNGANNER